MQANTWTKETEWTRVGSAVKQLLPWGSQGEQMKGRPSETLRDSAFLEKWSTDVVIDSQAMLANHSLTSKYKVDVSYVFT